MPCRRSRITRSAAASIAVVSSPPSPSPTTGSRSSRVGSSTSTPRTSSTASRQTWSQSVTAEEQETADELRVEVGALLRHRLAALGDGEDVLDPGRAHQHRDLGLTRVDGAYRLLPIRCVADAVVPEPVDELYVELVPVNRQLERAVVTVEHGGGAVGRHMVERLAGISRQRLGRQALVRLVLEDTVGREDHQAGVVEADEHREARRFPPQGERSLVAVVTVGDQQLAVGERLGDAVGREPPDPGAVHLEVGFAIGPLGRRCAFVEEEQRLELGVHLAQQPQSALLRPAVGALVRQHDALLVRLGLERRDESLTRARDSVWADVVLREPPEARLGLVDQRLVLAPGAPGAAGFALVGRAASGGRRCAHSVPPARRARRAR